MTDRRHDPAVIFGGAGFIGRHFAEHLLANGFAGTVHLCDLHEPDPAGLSDAARKLAEEGRLCFESIDVRREIPAGKLPAAAGLAANFAAIHREPGHRPEEYFETNVQGARNVCAWAENVSCDTVVFTSSIAPYGSSNLPRTEESEPAPVTPYGKSKLEAEGIHREWQAAKPAARRLVIVRPGVVFGPGEGGNVTRLIGAVRRGLYCYPGNRKVYKAGGYVKELCLTMTWVLERMREEGEGVRLYNFTMNPPPRMEDYVKAIGRVLGGERWVPDLPFFAVGSLAALVRVFGMRETLHPVRVRKLVAHNNVVPRYLVDAGYEYRFTLDEALADWRRECPRDWGKA